MAIRIKMVQEKYALLKKDFPAAQILQVTGANEFLVSGVDLQAIQKYGAVVAASASDQKETHIESQPAMPNTKNTPEGAPLISTDINTVMLSFLQLVSAPMEAKLNKEIETINTQLLKLKTEIAALLPAAEAKISLSITEFQSKVNDFTEKQSKFLEDATQKMQATLSVIESNQQEFSKGQITLEQSLEGIKLSLQAFKDEYSRDRANVDADAKAQRENVSSLTQYLKNLPLPK